MSSFAYINATVSSTPLSLVTLGFTAAQVAAAGRAIVTSNTNAINATLNGAIPSATSGHTVQEGTSIQIVGRDDLAAALLVATGSDATVSITLQR